MYCAIKGLGIEAGPASQLSIWYPATSTMRLKRQLTLQTQSIERTARPFGAMVFLSTGWHPVQFGVGVLKKVLLLLLLLLLITHVPNSANNPEFTHNA